MRLTRYTDFCFRVLIHVGLKGEALSTTREISDRYQISNNHLMKVVYDLNVLGYLETVRGKNGGIRLGRAPDSINLGTLIRETETDSALAECQTADNRCRIAPGCRLREVLSEALGAFLTVLDRYTLADLLEPKEELSRLLGLDFSQSALARNRAFKRAVR
jgi:Rrf2 family nitric oxide-sensitive transcriptional repressor